MPVSPCWTHSETDSGQDLNLHLKSTGSIFGEPRDVWALRIGVSSNLIFHDLQKVLIFLLQYTVTLVVLVAETAMIKYHKLNLRQKLIVSQF